MSWSVSFMGRSEKVVEALEAESGRLSGQSKLEYDEAMPHLIALVKNNFARRDANVMGGAEPIVDLSANGSGSVLNGEQVQRSCQVTLKTEYRRLLL